MREITARIVKNDIQRPPTLRLEKLGKYSFSTRDDGGSGAQFRGLITFDLANMEVSNIPFNVHDSALLDPIEKPPLPEKIREYDMQTCDDPKMLQHMFCFGFVKPWMFSLKK